MSKEQRKRAGLRRLTAYCVAGGFSMKLFLRREHNVVPRVFDALYTVSRHNIFACVQTQLRLSVRCTICWCCRDTASTRNYVPLHS